MCVVRADEVVVDDEKRGGVVGMSRVVEHSGFRGVDGISVV